MTDGRFQLPLQLAGVPVVVTASVAEEPSMLARYGAYRAASATDGWTLEITYETSEILTQPEGLRYPAYRPTLRDGEWVFERKGERLRIDVGRRAARLTTRRPAAPPLPKVAPCAEASLRVVVALGLAGRGFLVHAAGYGGDTGAVLFAAQGGGGKTTTAGKLPHARVLGDDQVAVTLEHDRFIAHALPFVGEYAMPTLPRQAPLSHVYFLAKAPAPLVTPLRRAQALARLASVTVQHLPPSEDLGTFALVSRLVDEIPASTLALALDSPVLSYLPA